MWHCSETPWGQDKRDASVIFFVPGSTFGNGQLVEVEFLKLKLKYEKMIHIMQCLALVFVLVIRTLRKAQTEFRCGGALRNIFVMLLSVSRVRSSRKIRVKLFGRWKTAPPCWRTDIA